MTNTIFYTFSTIAQTLAGAFALLGAFVLYRLQSLRSGIEKDCSDIVHEYNLDIVHKSTMIQSMRALEVRNLQRQGKYQMIVEFPTEGMNNPRIESSVKDMQSRLSQSLKKTKSLRKWFTISLGLTVVSILSSVVALVAAELIAGWDVWGWRVLIVGLLVFGICLCSYVVLIQKAIE